MSAQCQPTWSDNPDRLSHKASFFKKTTKKAIFPVVSYLAVPKQLKLAFKGLFWQVRRP